VTRQRLDDPPFKSRKEKELYLFSTTFKPFLAPIHLLIQWAAENVSPGEKQEGREVHPNLRPRL
jgi:hypothetical protein